MVKKIISTLLALSIFTFVLQAPVKATENETIVINTNDFVSSEGEKINPDQLAETKFAIPLPFFFIPGLGQVAVLATGAVIVGGMIFSSKSWEAQVVKHHKMTANEYISKNRKASIRNKFPTEYLNKTIDQINKDASKGIKKAKTAKKLLTDNRFKKDTKKKKKK
ncbi:hypothetical protein [Bacillus sp. 005/A4HT-01/001]|uniref:hypothetical protein n=1 Tax=Bacillus sp. 005/A4HT-01/001 TaxID=2509010 RepID=UPI001074AAB2|nr:hypothetical protein [Bacillus sp. 005/A4HT-01/001]TFW45531.1 hypothetical protein ES896_19850 [Bacillus sp. 005/A4HT-01/001]